MKVFILAGGRGTRLGEETQLRPKPMVEIGGKPILWHIMKIYSHYGFNDFVVLGGYKADMIKDWFVNYGLKFGRDVVDLSEKTVTMERTCEENWKVTVLDTGLDTMTGSRIKKAAASIDDDGFLLTYGDGVADVDIGAVIEHHKKMKKTVTLSAVQPTGRWGAIDACEDGTVKSFEEKPQGDGGWINGGFFVCDKKALDYIGEGEDVIWEREPLQAITEAGMLGAYKHRGFWHPMDMLRDKIILNDMWKSGNAPWRVWG